MPYDGNGNFWLEKRDGVFLNKEICYMPPPEGESPEPPPPMGASQEAVDKWEKEHEEGI